APDAAHLIAVGVLLGAHTRVEQPPAGGEHRTAPTAPRAVDLGPDDRVGGQVVGTAGARSRVIRTHQSTPRTRPTTDDLGTGGGYRVRGGAAIRRARPGTPRPRSPTSSPRSGTARP